MRAIYLRDDSKPEIGETICIKDDRATHLIKATRIRKGEPVLILDGEGTSYLSEATEITRREIYLNIKSSDQRERGVSIDLCLGLPKKDAFELALKNSVELGVGEIFPFSSEYSQWNIKNIERTNQLIESALIQSNNFFFTKLNDVSENIQALEDVFSKYDYIVLTTLKESRDFSTVSVDKSKKYLIIIGPEGGLSDAEEEYILSLDKAHSLKLNTPILRTPNAVSTIVGFLHGKFAAS
jgi:16S rRNA (uracil1498-N3)-methyltransferase